MNANFIGHNVFEIGKIEVESFYRITRIKAVAIIRVHRLLAELPVIVVPRDHFDSTLCLFVVGTIVEKRSGNWLMMREEGSKVQYCTLYSILVTQFPPFVLIHVC